MDRAESGKIIVRMLEILTAMEYGKPNDRSAADRKWAIAITDYEKAIAVFYWFVWGRARESGGGVGLDPGAYGGVSRGAYYRRGSRRAGGGLCQRRWAGR